MGKQVRIQWIAHTLAPRQTGAITLMIIAHAGTWANRCEYNGKMHMLALRQTGAKTLMIIARANTWANRCEYNGYRTR